MPVKFFFNAKNITLRQRTALKVFIEDLFKSENRKLQSLSYIFCSDKELLKINNEFLRHDYFTDIITFELSNSKNTIEAEIYISIDRVRENALNFNQTIEMELHRVIFHGALHLCGYKDKSQRDKIKMSKAEDKYLNQYFGEPNP